MSKGKADITVFEHQTIKLGQKFGEVTFDADKLQALQKHYGAEGKKVPYYTLGNNSICFNEYVGVIQVGKTLIEVLPKADKRDASQTNWRNVLIGMLKSVGLFEVKSSSNSNLKIKANTLLDLYFELFVNELEYLLHNGLIKKYRKKEGNVTALKGSLNFAKHIQNNLTHQERFYVRHTVYDREHKLHKILYKALNLLRQLNTNSKLHSRLGALSLDFPEMPDIRVSEYTFSNLVYNRKTKPYQTAIEIARLLLLNYHPDVSKGRNNVLALMFDMNLLWERFVYVSLRNKLGDGNTVTAQTSRYFWKPERGSRSFMRPDIVINKGSEENCVVLDTKWKNLGGSNPSPDDLRQMYVYHDYYGAKRVALVYPGSDSVHKGHYIKPDNKGLTDKQCSVMSIAVQEQITQWQESICAKMIGWMGPFPAAYVESGPNTDGQ